MIRLLIADGHTMFRQALARLLADVDDFAVAAEAQDDAGVIQALKSRRIDVAVLELALPERGGDCADQGSQGGSAGGPGADGEPRRAGPLPVACTARRRRRIHHQRRRGRRNGRGHTAPCGRGQVHLPAPSPSGRRSTSSAAISISPTTCDCRSREFEVFCLLVAGKRGADIAGDLSLSEKTVSSHKASVLRKLNLVGIAELVRYAIKHDLLPS